MEHCNKTLFPSTLIIITKTLRLPSSQAIKNFALFSIINRLYF